MRIMKMLQAIALLLHFAFQAYSQYDYDPYYANPNMNKNCYPFVVTADNRYIIRVGFKYGNSNLVRNTPVFYLQFDANRWTTVHTSINETIYHEMIILAKRDNMSVCVAKIKDDDSPFISSLELVQLKKGMYESMESDRALFLQDRVNFGTGDLVGNFTEKYTRIWQPYQPSTYTNLTVDLDTLISTVPEDPPVDVIRTAIQAPSPSDSINLSFKLQDSNRASFAILYFAELEKLGPGQNRTFDVYINGEDYNVKVSPMYQRCSEIHVQVPAPAGDFFNLTLVPSKNVSNLPPILSAMELFSVSEVIANTTAAQDVTALRELAQTSRELWSWRGDPCLPVSWQWLECDQENPPRITTLYLAGMDLIFLKDFSDMQMLEVIDLQDNNLLGEIPIFLGNFPKLRKLNLANNRLSGFVPKSLLNSKIELNISGNPNLLTDFPKMDSSERKHIGLIVGLWAAAISLVISFLIGLFIMWRRRGQIKVAAIELDTVQAETQAAHA